MKELGNQMQILEGLYNDVVARVCASLRNTPDKWEGGWRGVQTHTDRATVRLTPTFDKYGEIHDVELLVITKSNGEQTQIPLGIVDDWRLRRAYTRFIQTRKDKRALEILSNMSVEQL